MRTFALLIPILSVLAWSCNDSEAAREPLYGAQLPATTFVVNPAKDTVLKTPGGALITVPAGALASGEGSAVTLEVKEAYTPTDMTRGGLMHNGGETLSSSGMIYVNVAAGQSVTINKPLSIAIPAKEAAGEMMVYKGEAGEDGVRWTDAKPLTSSPTLTNLAAGKTLFITNCAACHGLKDEAAGPPVAWITQRRDKQWLYAFTRSNATLLWRGDGYSCYLFNRYKTPMPQYPNLTDADLANLYHYIDHVSHAVDSNAVLNPRASFDSCVKNDPNCGEVASRVRPLPAHEGTDTAVAAVTDYYTFAVDKHGWYSVAGKPGVGIAVTANATADDLPAAPDPVPHVEPLKACPCWCDERAYRRADSLGRAR